MALFKSFRASIDKIQTTNKNKPLHSIHSLLQQWFIFCFHVFQNRKIHLQAFNNNFLKMYVFHNNLNLLHYEHTCCGYAHISISS
nr:MAG TPA: hypothetical protein [Caudoviricetes sp.]DAR71444.1 MAG TPA: hypothetical protein [Caudoviricetes sp.]DAR86221.1 MAG TPA: hypothetical protein [Caudoviricetes sp.]DAS32501.1 MAG TPA: hypothetical protein [Caudoviricetes sp.]